jgi:hypothetical protein
MPFDFRQFNKRVLLTGAGFSRNWGGRLAREMWEEIFSHPEIQKRPNLRTLLIRTPMFEDAISIITDPKTYNDDDRTAMNSAVREAFRRMDDEHIARLASGNPLIDTGGIRELFGRFYSQQHRAGYIFSLNQDALKERLAGLWVDLPFSLPGIRYLPTSSPPEIGTPRLAYPATPDTSNMRFDGNLNYIKLHGSFLWRPDDGSPGMVLGGSKQMAIGRSPLLTAYQNVFGQVLNAGEVRLLVVGYSFQDSHINGIIATAVQSFSARLFIWDMKDPLQLLKEVPIADSAFPGRTIDLRPYLCGAASRPLSHVFPWNDHPTPEYKRIVASFF